MHSRRPVVLIGTKAQFIKTAPVLRALDNLAVDYELVYTGQHSETFEVLEKAFGTKAADLVLVPEMEAATKRSFISWSVMFWLNVIRHMGRWYGARWGLVHGDTASTLFSAVALKLARVRVVHVEAGLRSPRLFNPFPEEIVRRLVSRLAVLHLAPDADAMRNLAGVSGQVIDTGGNTMRDALLLALAKMGEVPEFGGAGNYAVVSIHRSENLESSKVFDWLMHEVMHVSSKIDVFFVLHPATRERIKSSGWLQRLQRQSGLSLLERMDYPDFVRLLISSRFLMTDGGSNQEEAAMLGLPTLLMRQETERPDGLGDNVVLSELDIAATRSFVEKYTKQQWPVRSINTSSPSEIIASILTSY